MKGGVQLPGLARKALDSLIDQAQGDPKRLAAVASVALSAGEAERAYALACEARRLAPGDASIRAATQASFASGVPAWHFQIVRDEARNAAWNAAIERAATPDSLVLDVGAGTGLLSMMAARAGAPRVVACEMNPAVADAAERIVAANGFSERVTIVRAHSRELTVERMGGKADLFVSEIISNNVVSQDAVDTVRDVVRRLVKPGGKVIPAATAARVALAWWDGAEGRRLGEIEGFDLREFNALESPPHQVPPDDRGLHLRSAPADLFEFDFQRLRFPEPGAQLDLAAEGGEANGIVQWLHIGLDEVTTYENPPGAEGRSCWACLFYPFAEPIDPAPGTFVRVAAEWVGNELRIWKADEPAAVDPD